MRTTRDCSQKEVRVYSYARWSSDAQSDGDSLRRQSQLAEDWCQGRGLTLAGFDKDEGISAWKGRNQREGSGLSRLLKQVKRGDFLLVEDTDRLSRQDWLTACNFLRDILKKDVIVVTLKIREKVCLAAAPTVSNGGANLMEMQFSATRAVSKSKFLPALL